MINFKSSNLYSREQTRMENFLNKKLVTGTEQQENEFKARVGAVNEPITLDTLVEGNEIDMESRGYEDEEGYGSFGGSGDRSGVKGDTSWKEEGQPFMSFIKSPIYLVTYIFTDITRDLPSKEEWKGIIKVFNVGNMVSISVALLEILLGINNIFSSHFQLIAGVIMFLITTSILTYVYKEETYAMQFIRKLTGKESEDVEPVEFSDDDNRDNTSGEVMGSIFGDTDFGEDKLNLEEGMGDVQGVHEVVDFGELEDEEVEGEVHRDTKDRLALAESSIRVDTNDIFKEDLLRVFKRNNKYLGKEIDGRVELIHSLSDYLIQNDVTFGQWKRPKERSLEYNNISYAIFKGLVGIERRFGEYVDGTDPEAKEEQMVVSDIRKSPLLYRIELELPSYFNLRKIQNNIKVLEDMLRESEDDDMVSILVTTLQGRVVIKLLRLDSKKLVSLGDILRFKDEEKGYAGMEAYDDADTGLPVLLGLKNNEFPYIVDLEANTSGVIVGGSGSGKSWTTFEIMMNLVTTNDYNAVNFIILDAKNATFWRTFAKLPHVLGYHTDPMEYLEILNEVEEERLRRQEFLNSVNSEDVRGYRKRLRREGKFEEMKDMPLLYVIMDEITATMAELRMKDEDTFKAVSEVMGMITQKGRSAGVRILSIGQRSTYDSIPKSVMANSSFKYGMKMNVANDFITLLGDDVKNYTYPNTPGMGLATVEGVMGLSTVKSLTVGGKDDDQMLWLVRVLALEWVRRSYGNGDFTKQPKGMNFVKSFNRNKYYTLSLQELKEGRILTSANIDKGYEVDLDGYAKEHLEDIEYEEVNKPDEVNNERVVNKSVSEGEVEDESKNNFNERDYEETPEYGEDEDEIDFGEDDEEEEDYTFLDKFNLPEGNGDLNTSEEGIGITVMGDVEVEEDIWEDDSKTGEDIFREDEIDFREDGIGFREDEDSAEKEKDYADALQKLERDFIENNKGTETINYNKTEIVEMGYNSVPKEEKNIETQESQKTEEVKSLEGIILEDPIEVENNNFKKTDMYEKDGNYGIEDPTVVETGNVKNIDNTEKDLESLLEDPIGVETVESENIEKRLKDGKRVGEVGSEDWKAVGSEVGSEVWGGNKKAIPEGYEMGHPGGSDVDFEKLHLRFQETSPKISENFTTEDNSVLGSETAEGIETGSYTKQEKEETEENLDKYDDMLKALDENILGDVSEAHVEEVAENEEVLDLEELEVDQDVGKDVGLESILGNTFGVEDAESIEKEKSKETIGYKDLGSLGTYEDVGIETVEDKERSKSEKDVEDKKEEKIEIDFYADVKERKEEPEMSVKRYILLNGSRRGMTVYINKDDLEDVYRKDTIERAVRRMSIIEKDGVYMTQV